MTQRALWRDETCDSCMDSPQPSQQTPKTEMELSRKALWRSILSNGLNPHDILRRLTRIIFENIIPAETLPACTEREERGWNERRLTHYQNSTGRKQAGKKWLGYQYNDLSWKREDGSKGRPKPRGWGLSTQGQMPQTIISRLWNLADFPQLDAKTAWNQWLFPSFHFLTLGIKMSVIVKLRLFHYCILRASNLFPSFTGLQMERNCEPGWIIWVSPKLDVNDLDDETAKLMIFDDVLDLELML